MKIYYDTASTNILRIDNKYVEIKSKRICTDVLRKLFIMNKLVWYYVNKLEIGVMVRVQ